MSLVDYRVTGRAAVITLMRADKRNALSRPLVRELRSAFERARDDASARVVILAADGPVFCAGMDLAELRDTVEAGPEKSPVWDDAQRLAELFDLIYTLPKPTIAAVQGPAVAGGSGLATVCDLAIASETATFGYPEVRRGLVAALVMPHLLRHVGERMARFLLLTGEMIDARTAAVVGLINDVAAPKNLMSRVDALAESLVAGGPEALALTKRHLHDFSGQSLSVAELAKASAAPRLGPECLSGLRAYFEKKPAPWLAE